MTPGTLRLTAMARHDVATLPDLLDHDGRTDEHCTAEEATALWDAGWHAWRGEGREGQASWHAGAAQGEGRHAPWASDHDSWAAQRSLQSLPLWHITRGMVLRVLHAAFPALPGTPVWAALREVEEEETGQAPGERLRRSAARPRHARALQAGAIRRNEHAAVGVSLEDVHKSVTRMPRTTQAWLARIQLSVGPPVSP